MYRWNSGLAVLMAVATTSWAMHAVAQNAPEEPAAPEAKDVIETAQEAGAFETLLHAIEAAELTETLQGEGPFTIFAPTDAAFAKLPEGELEALLEPENKEQLIALLQYHVVPDQMFIDYAVASGEVETLTGQTIQVEASDGKVLLNGEAEVIEADIHASNGMLHAIDTVLTSPPAEEQ